MKISTDGGSTWSILGSYLDPYPEDQASSSNQGIPGEPCFSGSSGGWEKVSFDLSAYAGEQVIFRWHFGSDTSVTYDGWYIDDVAVTVQGSSVLMNDTPVYTSSTLVSINAYETRYVEFTPGWTVDDFGVYAVNVETVLPGDQDVSNDKSVGVVEISSAPAGHIAGLFSDWNFVSLPFNQSVVKSSLLVNFGGVDYTWADAVAAGVVSDYIFGWDRVGQSYMFSDVLEPGYGYWLYAYEPCELKAPVFETGFEGYITVLQEKWNVVGCPNDTVVLKADVLVRYGGVDYNWSDAVAAGIISDYIFGWDGAVQSYVFSDQFTPGECYWLYAYDACVLRTDV